MIREIRAISENFTSQGLANHPEVPQNSKQSISANTYFMEITQFFRAWHLHFGSNISTWNII
jgi:hypothetical protein